MNLLTEYWLTQAGRGAFRDQVDDAKRGVKGLKDILTSKGKFSDLVKGEKFIRRLEELGIFDIKGKTEKEIAEEIRARASHLLDSDLEVEVKFYGKDDIKEIKDLTTLAKLDAQGFAVAADGSIWVNTEVLMNNNTLNFNKLFAHEIGHLMGGNETVANYMEKSYGEFVGGIGSSGYVDIGGSIRDWGKNPLNGEDANRLLKYGLDEIDFKTLYLTPENLHKLIEFVRSSNDYLSGGLPNSSLFVKADDNGKNLLPYLSALEIIDTGKKDENGLAIIEMNFKNLPSTYDEQLLKALDDVYIGPLSDVALKSHTFYVFAPDNITKWGSGRTPFSSMPDPKADIDEMVVNTYVIGQAAVLGFYAFVAQDPVKLQQAGTMIAATNMAIKFTTGRDPMGETLGKQLYKHFPNVDHTETIMLFSTLYDLGAANAGNLYMGAKTALTPDKKMVNENYISDGSLSANVSPTNPNTAPGKQIGDVGGSRQQDSGGWLNNSTIKPENTINKNAGLYDAGQTQANELSSAKAPPSYGNGLSTGKVGDVTPANYVNLASKSRTEHILTGDNTTYPGGGHMYPATPGKSEFPKNWSGDKIMHELSEIVTNPKNVWVPDKVSYGVQRYRIEAISSGIKIRVITDGKDIITGFPIK
ncbi:EndoU domain-containing protein [Fusobacterium sp. PH5-44]|uniref:EndoU domain-containing protein n=1 Tax=unclassified Fusobacterium TaxID=2648384 RepID=UPI003D1EBECA